MGSKIALITGATSGIGAAFAKKYASMGYDLMITGRRLDKITRLAEEIRETNGVNVEIITAELSDQKDVDAIIDEAKGKNIQVLINNAGFGMNTLFQKGDLNLYKTMIDVHILAPVRLIYAILPAMIQRASGTIINVSSESAFLLIPKNAVYSGTKSFLKNFTEALALDLKGTGIQVQALCPGLTRSDFHEKMGIRKAKQVNRGVIKWALPDKVVQESLNDLAKNRVVCIPGMYEKVLIKIANVIPRSLYNKLVYKFF
jgi:short-subunit dehydrogenase